MRGFSSAELDVTDAVAFHRVLGRLRPDAVINAAALGVEASEVEPQRAHHVNAIAPGHMAQACQLAGTPFIHISTDYVFGDVPDRPWRESDPVSPLNSYGHLKAEGEHNALAAAGGVCICRVAWLFGDQKDFIARLLQGNDDPVRVAYDQIGSPTPIFHVAKRLLELASRMVAGDVIPEILHLAGSPPVSRADWVATAFDARRRAGKRTPKLVPVSMSEFGSQIPRPSRSALDCTLATQIFADQLDWQELTMRADTFSG
ncbi:dTDP-4-dehydrorhamnose reductase [Rhodopseudomonas julia]|uniref:dTDP-4-dehydrorhamnose reductase n=1 Tax=Rhodopseudomonas julia TaxID=200617 RepID=A0ABU0C7C6_9BRAD|nr:dTDP-4-dehydrorhamnose reductase [Rhodopseudomonas julia]